MKRKRFRNISQTLPMKTLFVDTDIIIDLLAKREPYFDDTAKLFTLAEEDRIKLYSSAISFAAVNYVLLKEKQPSEAKLILRQLKMIVKIANLNEEIVSLSANDLNSMDFKDALQYHSALYNRMDFFITRNLSAFKKSQIPVMTPEQFLNGVNPI